MCICNVLCGNMVRGGIRVFRVRDDDQNDNISEMEAIKSSQLCVLVFSRKPLHPLMTMNGDGIFFYRRPGGCFSLERSLCPSSTEYLQM
ncbi:hypothetical protein SAY86_028882 [Trapa natans]|uniref:Uncharacterized protein n=1 Tax=Trapa natans TaxID=22666 RepID=A0AAN7M0B9_TRANT|nr:hypothetical protein SAY86_028882 [Trapa natans]